MLRGLLETSITERVNLVNAMALAKARGITVVERRTPDAGAFAAQLTLSSETPDGPAVGRRDRRRRRGAPDPARRLPARHGAVATRCSSPATSTGPGTVGRIGLILGAADVNISAMQLARSRPREDALMILALDDEVPDSVVDAIRADEAILDVWSIELGTDR